jgi:hypothetical protein
MRFLENNQKKCIIITTYSSAHKVFTATQEWYMALSKAALDELLRPQSPILFGVHFVTHADLKTLNVSMAQLRVLHEESSMKKQHATLLFDMEKCVVCQQHSSRLMNIITSKRKLDQSIQNSGLEGYYRQKDDRVGANCRNNIAATNIDSSPQGGLSIHAIHMRAPVAHSQQTQTRTETQTQTQERVAHGPPEPVDDFQNEAVAEVIRSSHQAFPGSGIGKYVTTGLMSEVVAQAAGVIKCVINPTSSQIQAGMITCPPMRFPNNGFGVHQGADAHEQMLPSGRPLTSDHQFKEESSVSIYFNVDNENPSSLVTLLF